VTGERRGESKGAVAMGQPVACQAYSKGDVAQETAHLYGSGVRSLLSRTTTGGWILYLFFRTDQRVANKT